MSIAGQNMDIFIHALCIDRCTALIQQPVFLWSVDTLISFNNGAQYIGRHIGLLHFIPQARGVLRETGTTESSATIVSGDHRMCRQNSLVCGSKSSHVLVLDPFLVAKLGHLVAERYLGRQIRVPEHFDHFGLFVGNKVKVVVFDSVVFVCERKQLPDLLFDRLVLGQPANSEDPVLVVDKIVYVVFLRQELWHKVAFQRVTRTHRDSGPENNGSSVGNALQITQHRLDNVRMTRPVSRHGRGNTDKHHITFCQVLESGALGETLLRIEVVCQSS